MRSIGMNVLTPPLAGTFSPFLKLRRCLREYFVALSSHSIWKEKGYEKFLCMGYESASHRPEGHYTSETNGRRCVFLGRGLEVCLPEPGGWTFHEIRNAVPSCHRRSCCLS